jgi:hypothetical protein
MTSAKPSVKPQADVNDPAPKAVPAKLPKVKAKLKSDATTVKPVKPVKRTTASKPADIKSQAKVKPVAEQKEKIKKTKLVRDSFTMPEAEYAILGEVKKACLKAGFEIKKSELLRVGVALIQKIDTTQLKDALAALQPLKAGRPKQDKPDKV